jgi:SAM-dependent methyltransferase
LPFGDASFDAVASTFGVMFTPDQDKAAAELLRACKRGGKIGLANWTLAGFVGQMFKTLGKYIPPQIGSNSPALWGTRERLDELFTDGVASIIAEPRNFMFRYRSSEHFINIFRTYYGPMFKAFGTLDDAKQNDLKGDLHALTARMNKANDGTMVVPGEYLENYHYEAMKEKLKVRCCPRGGPWRVTTPLKLAVLKASIRSRIEIHRFLETLEGMAASLVEA